MKQNQSKIIKLILILSIIICFANGISVSSSQKLNIFNGSIKQLATMLNKAFENKTAVGNIKMLQQLKKQLVQMKQEEPAQAQGILNRLEIIKINNFFKEVKIIKMHKDVLVEDQIIVKKDAKFDKVIARDEILVSENIYSKGSESKHIQANDLYMSSINSLNTDDSIIIQGKIVTKKLTAGDKANISALKVNGQKQWQIIEHEDFESANVQQNNAWSLIEQNSCEMMTENKFNGGYCKVSSQQITKLFKDLPEHTQIKLSGTLHAFDNWEGEKLFVQVNGKRIWSKNIDNTKGISVCGNEKNDSINIKFEKILLSTDNNVEVSFGSELNKDSCDASFAIDDIMISVR